MGEIDDNILKEFVAEAREHLATIETDLLAIEEAGAEIDEDRVNKVFRAAHSIKGASGFFGLEKIKVLAHKAETVLDLIRSRKLAPNSEITNLLLGAFDKLREMVNDPARSEASDTQPFLIGLVELAQSVHADAHPERIGTIVSMTGTELPVVLQVPSAPSGIDRGLGEKCYVYQVQVDLFADVEQRGRTLIEFIRDLSGAGEILSCQVDGDSSGSLESPGGRKLPTEIVFSSPRMLDPSAAPFFLSAREVKLVSIPSQVEERGYSAPIPQPSVSAAPDPASVPTVSRPPKTPSSTTATQSPPAAKDKDGSAADGTLRVSVGLLESLMNLAGELVLSRNQLRAVLNQSQLRGVQASFQRINLVTSELQDAIMQTRMQSIGNVFAKFPRVVRDMSKSLKKDIQLDIRGKDVGLDKSLIEGLSDPLTHMVRNAVDHGIESAEDRVRVGKRPSGNLRIEARHEAGQVVLEIADDGKGIDPSKIAAAPVARGLITPEAMQTMSDQEKMHLIFLPGLSTAEKVTDVSGRGVGMDVVKTNLARLGGKVDIESEIGHGTLFRIKLPLTLAIIPSLVVSVNGERFAIPQISVVELLRIRADKVKERINVIGDAEVLMLRDELIPIVRFADVLAIKRTCEDRGTGEIISDRRERLADRRSANHGVAIGEEDFAGRADAVVQRRAVDRRQNASSDLDLVVVSTGSMKYGLVVDFFLTGEEIVVKPLGRHLKGLHEYAGATIMGDGTVALIVDAAGVASKALLSNVAAAARETEAEAALDNLVESRPFLLFHNASEELCATPLESVVRVEKATHKQIENVGGKRTMQYRGNFLPLVTLSDVARVGSIGEDQDLAVIVVKIGEREVGLLAAMPVDVIESKASIDAVTHRQTGIAGSTIMRDNTVLVADVFEIAQTMFPEWNLQRNTDSPPSSVAARQVVLAEDSDFFRAQVRRYLESDGFAVLEAADGELAWKLLQEHGDTVQAVVTDVEMPNLTGLGLAARLRKDPRFRRLPIIALTSLASEDDIAKGKAAGVDEYQVKLDQDQLLESLHRLLARQGGTVSEAVGTGEIQEGA
jgi:two-component system, chemotaxis family, sensor kinase CheA